MKRKMFTSVLVLMALFLTANNAMAEVKQVVFQSATSSDKQYKEGADKLIDGDLNTKWTSGILFMNNRNGGIKVVFDAGKKVAGQCYWFYTSYDTENEERNPSDWIIEGSNDQKKWKQLDYRHNEILPLTRSTKSTVYNLSNKAPYRYYRLTIIAGRTSAIVELGEFCMQYAE